MNWVILFLRLVGLVQLAAKWEQIQNDRRKQQEIANAPLTTKEENDYWKP